MAVLVPWEPPWARAIPASAIPSTQATDAEVAAASATKVAARQSANVKVLTVTPAQGTHPVALMACPPLVPNVTKVLFAVSFEFTPASGCTGIYPSINESDVDGVYIGNIAFWRKDQPIVANRDVFAAQWLYDPRLNPDPPEVPDVDLGTGAGRYVGLHVTTIGGNCAVTSAIIQAVYGDAVVSITADTNQTSLLDDQD